MKRVYCPRHKEDTPSCVIYDKNAYCYGGCGVIPLEEVGEFPPSSPPKPKYQEDLITKRNYINGLPKKEIRGFNLHYDLEGYYICWPNDLYYKQRLFESKETAKYKNPAGHSQPLFIVRRAYSRVLYLVEGEINAMSVSRALPEYDVASPGSASDFLAEKFTRDLPLYCTYSTIVILVDRDAPGAAAAIRAKSLLLTKVPKVHIGFMEKDANEWLCEDGKEALRQEIKKQMQEKL